MLLVKTNGPIHVLTRGLRMKHLLTATALGCFAAGLLAAPAQANNTVVENALKARPELSTFYQGLVSTGVISELKEGQSYTVFAPTNEAFARLSPEQYPCFYAPQCKGQVAQILRSHIVEGEKHIDDISLSDNRGKESGGIMSLFSLNNTHLIVSEPYKHNYTVDGKKIISQNQLLGAELYPVSGVLVSDRDLVQFTQPQISVVHVARSGTDLPPRVADGTVVTITTETPVTVVPVNQAPAPSSSY
jgi:uncharacterized surface protein with fasciclin (FAS1) repeats